LSASRAGLLLAAPLAGGGTPQHGALKPRRPLSNPPARRPKPLRLTKVCSGATGHTEVVKVCYDPEEVPFETVGGALAAFLVSKVPGRGLLRFSGVCGALEVGPGLWFVHGSPVACWGGLLVECSLELVRRRVELSPRCSIKGGLLFPCCGAQRALRSRCEGARDATLIVGHGLATSPRRPPNFTPSAAGHLLGQARPHRQGPPGQRQRHPVSGVGLAGRSVRLCANMRQPARGPASQAARAHPALKIEWACHRPAP
jgi:hypothetical protein